jgi:hypothetical protein
MPDNRPIAQNACAKPSLKTLAAGKSPIHRRRISISTYPLEGLRVLVEGWLHDERMVPIYRHWDSRPRHEGPIHGLCLRLLVGGYPLAVEDAEAEMPITPNSLCDTAQDSVKKLIGLEIRSGYSERVRDIMGGAAGCTHLTHLAVVMGPAALHGFWTFYAQNPRPAPKTLDQVEGLEYLLNSCHLWTPDGPYVTELKELLKTLSAEERTHGQLA